MNKNKWYQMSSEILYGLAEKYSEYMLPEISSCSYTEIGNAAELEWLTPVEKKYVWVTADNFMGEVKVRIRCKSDDYDKIYTLTEEDLVEIIPDQRVRKAFIRYGLKWKAELVECLTR